jgi:acetyl esterase/lipase
MDWDDAYSNSAYIPDADQIVARWSLDAAAFRAAARVCPPIRYGESDRLNFDLFLPAAKPRGLVVFVHGGYWMSFDKSHWSHLAAGPVERGWAVAVPSYDLCPDVRITKITGECAAAVSRAASEVDGPIVLAGHSAGGHLVTRLMCAWSPLATNLVARIRRVVAISGLFDLRPLMQTSMNRILKIDEAEARSESPALLKPLPGPELVAWVGALERPEFRRQTALISNIWFGLGARVREVVAAGRHHFDVIAPLSSGTSDLTAALVGDDLGR